MAEEKKALIERIRRVKILQEEMKRPIPEEEEEEEETSE